jgi:hypothetical protein
MQQELKNKNKSNFNQKTILLITPNFNQKTILLIIILLIIDF